MRNFMIIILLLTITNCSVSKDSQYSTEKTNKSKKNQKNLNEILKKSDDITSMTLEEYKIYIDDYTKKSKYPDISK